MAKETRWSVRADHDRIEILEYWFNRNKSAAYSIKLANLFNQQINLISEFPESGRPCKLPFIRIKVLKEYFIYHKINSEFIEIVTIWDSRRDPKKFKL